VPVVIDQEIPFLGQASHRVALVFECHGALGDPTVRANDESVRARSVTDLMPGFADLRIPSLGRPL
jgi:hypothetical protein